jgi:membrane-associated phospholipid phosphatase
MNLHLAPGLRNSVNSEPVPQAPRSPLPGLALAGALAALFVALTWFVAGPANGGGIDQMLNRKHDISAYAPTLHIVDRIGQRAVCLPVLGVVTAWVSWRHRSARPVLIAVCAVLGVNLIVLVLKLWLARGAPLAHRPAFFIDGQKYPSGHTSNIVGMYGTAAYLASRYGEVSRGARRVMFGIVTLLSLVMTMTSLLLRWHWFTDLIAGFLVGGMVLSVLAAFDLATPFSSSRWRSPPERASAR